MGGRCGESCGGALFTAQHLTVLLVILSHTHLAMLATAMGLGARLILRAHRVGG